MKQEVKIFDHLLIFILSPRYRNCHREYRDGLQVGKREVELILHWSWQQQQALRFLCDAEDKCILRKNSDRTQSVRLSSDPPPLSLPFTFLLQRPESEHHGSHL